MRPSPQAIDGSSINNISCRASCQPASASSDRVRRRASTIRPGGPLFVSGLVPVMGTTSLDSDTLAPRHAMDAHVPGHHGAEWPRGTRRQGRRFADRNRDRRLRSGGGRVGQDSGRSAPCVQPNPPGRHQRESVPAARDVFPRSLQFSITIDRRTSRLGFALDCSGGHALDSLVHHSDAGSQHLAMRYTERLAAAGMAPSVGNQGDAFDNALAEAVIGLFKTEVIRRQGP